MDFERVNGFEIANHKSFAGDPVGFFEAKMTENGWRGSKYVNKAERYITSDEVNEAVRFVHFLFKMTPDWKELEQFAVKYGKLTYGDLGEQTRAINYLGAKFDYTVLITGNDLVVFLYRKR